MQPTKASLRAVFAVGFIALIAAGCSSPTEEVDEAPAPAVTEDAAKADASAAEAEEELEPDEGASGLGEAVLSVGDDTFSVELRFCTLVDGEDALFHGPAFDASGNEVGYLDGDFTIVGGDAYGEARIDFGASAQFESTEEFLAIGDSFGAMVLTSFSDSEWFVIGTAWDHHGTQTSSSRLSVTC